MIRQRELHYIITTALFALTACAQGGGLKSTKNGDTVGIATMDTDRTLHLDLRSVECDGSEAAALVDYKVDDPHYAEVLSHIGGVEPGQRKPVPAWPEEPCPKN